MKAWEEYTLNELEQMRKEDWYEKQIEELEAIGQIAKMTIEAYYGRAIAEIYYLMEKANLEYESNDFFPGQKIMVYPRTKEQRAKKIITCDFSGGIIYPGSLYLSFRPLLKNIENKDTYVLKRTLKVEQGYYYDLPTNIQEFETLAQKVRLEQEEGQISYSHLSQRIGGVFEFQKLTSF